MTVFSVFIAGTHFSGIALKKEFFRSGIRWFYAAIRII